MKRIMLMVVGLVVLTVLLGFVMTKFDSPEIVDATPQPANLPLSTGGHRVSGEFDGVAVRPFSPPKTEEPSPETPDTVVAGICVNFEGDPLAGAEVRSLHQQGAWIFGTVVATSDESGLFSFPLHPSVESASLMLEFEYYNEDRSMLLLEPHLMVELEKGDLKDLGKVVLGHSTEVYGTPTKTRVEGRVVDQEGTPLASVDVSVFPRGLGKPVAVRTSQYGEFAISGLAVWGKDSPAFMVTVDSGSLGQAIRQLRPEHALWEVKPLEHNFQGGPGAFEEVTFTAISGPPPAVVHQARFHVPGFQSHEWLLLGASGEVISDGTTVFGGLAHVNYQLNELKRFMPLTVELTSFVDGMVVHLPVSVSGDGMQVGPKQHRIPCKRLTGMLVDQNGAPISGGLVVINRSIRVGFSRKNYREIRSNRKGEFEALLPAGSYKIVGLSTAPRLAEWAFTDNPSQEISIGSGETNIQLVAWK